MTDGLGLWIEVIIGYKEVDNFCTSCEQPVQTTDAAWPASFVTTYLL